MTAQPGRIPRCDLADWAAPGVRHLQPYLPGKPISELEREYGVRDSIKLASNENPLGVSPAALAAMREMLDELALYPDGGGFELRRALSAHHDIAPDRITLGNGSNDVLVLLAEAFLLPGREAVVSQYAFAVYPIAVQAASATLRVAAANAASHHQPLGHDLDAMLSLVNENTRLVFIANPNNPTGTWLEEKPLLAFLESVPESTVVVVDEAYHEYAVEHGVPDATAWLDRFPNLVVTRTFSKAYGLAGIRVGYGLSSAGVADLLNRVRQPFNVNSLALRGAEAALSDHAFIADSVRVNQAGLNRLRAGFAALGLQAIPSAGNFMLVNIDADPGRVYEGMLRRGVIVRPVGNYGLHTHLRVTVGTTEQNERMLEALSEVLVAQSS